MKVNKSIKKPKFLTTYFGSLLIVTIILACMGMIAFYGAKNTYDTLAQDDRSESEVNVQKGVETYLWKKRKITASERNDLKSLLVEHYSNTRQRFKVYFDNEEIADSSQSAFMFYYNDSENYNLEIADKKYLEYFKTPELLKYWQTKSERLSEYYDKDRILPKHNEGKSLELIVWEAYIDIENSRFIPVVCEIYDMNNNLNEKLRGPVVSIPIEKDGKIPEGYTLFRTSGNSHGFQATIEGFEDTDNEDEYNYLEYSDNGFDKYYGYKYTPLEYIPFATVYSAKIKAAVILMLVIAIFFSLIPATIVFNVQKRKYDIFEYRRMMTDAMAHDLKSPMAAISACAENLADNIDTENKEYYAGKIQEKVAQMNKMVNDILEFSKSENSPAVINKQKVDVGEVIAKALTDNDHTIIERSLKINYEKKTIEIQTDLKLFSQAISNLINNAVLYSKEGTAIDITFDENSMVISNIPKEKINDAEGLKQPFVKGSTERGTHGSGLGLAIAENNLAMLGYKLIVSSDEGRFVATVKL